MREGEGSNCTTFSSILGEIRLIFHKQVMEKRRVLLVCSGHLFGESVEAVLRAEADVELIGPWELGEEVCARIAEANPGVVLIVDEEAQSEVSARLTSAIMEAHPNLPIIRAGLTENVVRVISTHILPARGTDLMETIRSLPEAGNPSNERSEISNDGKR